MKYNLEFNMNCNVDIKELLKKYKLSYSSILPFLGNFSHVQRISEELAKPLSNERKKVYLSAIEKAKEIKRKEIEEIYKN